VVRRRWTSGNHQPKARAPAGEAPVMHDFRISGVYTRTWGCFCGSGKDPCRFARVSPAGRKEKNFRQEGDEPLLGREGLVCPQPPKESRKGIYGLSCTTRPGFFCRSKKFSPAPKLREPCPSIFQGASRDTLPCSSSFQKGLCATSQRWPSGSAKYPE
jgi:hypothetical protein